MNHLYALHQGYLKSVVEIQNHFQLSQFAPVIFSLFSLMSNKSVPYAMCRKDFISPCNRGYAYFSVIFCPWKAGIVPKLNSLWLLDMSVKAEVTNCKILLMGYRMNYMITTISYTEYQILCNSNNCSN